MANLSKTTQDHDTIRQWADERGGKPSHVARTGSGEDVGILRIDFPGYSGEGSLEEISWEDWFEKFDENNLALLYEETTAEGQKSNFNKIVSAATAEANEGKGRKSASKKRGAATKKKAAAPVKKSAATKKVAVKKAAPQKAVKKTATKKAAPKKVASKKAAPAKAAPKKAAAKKAAPKKAVAKKTAAKAPATKKTAAKKAVTKKRR